MYKREKYILFHMQSKLLLTEYLLQTWRYCFCYIIYYAIELKDIIYTLTGY